MEEVNNHSDHTPFLDASSDLYAKACPSVGPYVVPWVTLLLKSARKRLFGECMTFSALSAMGAS